MKNTVAKGVLALFGEIFCQRRDKLPVFGKAAIRDAEMKALCA